MKPAWEKLGKEYAGSGSVLIADVDCTDEDDGGKELCEEYDVKSFPTILFFKDGDMKGDKYEGGRDFNTMRQFVTEKLEIKCRVIDRKGCNEKEQAYVEKMKEKDQEEIKAQITRLKGMKGNSMKDELKAWLNQRIKILEQINHIKDMKREL